MSLHNPLQTSANVMRHHRGYFPMCKFINLCDKNNIKGKQTEDWLESGCQRPQWRWTVLDDIITPSGWGDKQRHTTEKAKEILHFCNSVNVLRITPHSASTYCRCFRLCPVLSTLQGETALFAHVYPLLNSAFSLCSHSKFQSM